MSEITNDWREDIKSIATDVSEIRRDIGHIIVDSEDSDRVDDLRRLKHEIDRVSSLLFHAIRRDLRARIEAEVS